MSKFGPTRRLLQAARNRYIVKKWKAILKIDDIQRGEGKKKEKEMKEKNSYIKNENAE